MQPASEGAQLKYFALHKLKSKVLSGWRIAVRRHLRILPLAPAPNHPGILLTSRSLTEILAFAVFPFGPGGEKARRRLPANAAGVAAIRYIEIQRYIFHRGVSQSCDRLRGGSSDRGVPLTQNANLANNIRSIIKQQDSSEF